MPISSGLNRLLRLRAIEEQSIRVQLASVLSELRNLQAALELAQFRQNRGQALVRTSIATGEAQGRYIGLEEIESGSAGARILNFRIEQASARAVELQAELAHKHRETKQIETLIRAALEQETTNLRRRMQRQLDEWARLHGSAENSSLPASSMARTTSGTTPATNSEIEDDSSPDNF